MLKIEGSNLSLKFLITNLYKLIVQAWNYSVANSILALNMYEIRAVDQVMTTNHS